MERFTAASSAVYTFQYLYLKEELIIGKHTVQETRHFSETVRREVPHLEREGDVVVHGSDAEDDL